MTNRTRLRLLAVATMAVVVAAGCTPTPGSSVVDGGSYVVQVSIPPQYIANRFDLPFGLGSCTAAVTTPAVDIPGTTVELPPFEYELGATTAHLPAVSIELPRSRVSAGSFSLTCRDQLIGSIGVVIDFDAVASVSGATVDLETMQVTLDQPTLSVTDATAVFAGAPAGTQPVPLDPITLQIPEFRIQL